MKKLYKNTKLFNIFALALSLCLGLEAYAASAVAVVSSLSGRAFVSVDGRTKSLSTGDQIPAFSEVFTEVGAQITLSDYYDHKYHLAGSGHVQFLNKQVELKEGYLWVQSFNDSHTFSIKTANAVAAFKRAEGIVSFDSYTGRSQILVKKGEFQYTNALNEYLFQNVSEGQFSFVMMEQDDGAPRAPTPIGYHSFKQIVSLFKDVATDSKTHMAPNREIASVVETPAMPVPQMQAAGTPSPRPTVNPVMEQQLKELYAPKLQAKKAPVKKWQPSYQQKSNAKVRIFGAPTNSVKRTPASPKKAVPKAKESSRTPASVGSMAPVIQTDSFESKLMQEYKSQMRHSDETNRLIKELKSFDQDYVEGY